MRLLRSAGHRRMAWKNGGGETIEVAVHPPEADLARFDWRISMASVSRDGPFSVFEGVDRTLCLLGGASMDLQIAGLGHRRLTADSPPLSFPADAATTARLEEGAIDDLNVMTRRGVCRHRVARRTILGRTAIDLSGRWNAVVVTGRCRCEAERFDEEAGAGDVLLADGAVPSVWSADRTRLAYVVEIDLIP